MDILKLMLKCEPLESYYPFFFNWFISLIYQDYFILLASTRVRYFLEHIFQPKLPVISIKCDNSQIFLSEVSQNLHQIQDR